MNKPSTREVGMLVRLITKEGSHTYQCEHVEVLESDEGVRVSVLPKGPTLRLPEDGERIYMMNDRGDTVDSYRWPPKVPKEVAHE